MAYSDKVIDHYENPRNVGTFDKDDSDVGTGMVGAPACGDVMRLQIKVNDQTTDDFDNLDALFDSFDGVTVEGGVDSENDDGCEGGACKI